MKISYNSDLIEDVCHSNICVQNLIVLGTGYTEKLDFFFPIIYNTLFRMIN